LSDFVTDKNSKRKINPGELKMNNNTDYLKDISEIRPIMERSARFLSLSGLCGICAGFTVLIGVLVAALGGF